MHERFTLDTSVAAKWFNSKDLGNKSYQPLTTRSRLTEPKSHQIQTLIIMAYYNKDEWTDRYRSGSGK